MSTKTITVMTCNKRALDGTIPQVIPDFAMRVNLSMLKSYAVRDWSNKYLPNGMTIPTRIRLSGGDWYDVIETPEQIDALINEANETDLTRIRSIVAQLKKEILDALRQNT